MSTAVLRSSGATSSEDRYAHKYVIAATVTMAAMLELIDTSIVNVAIPHMMGNLGATLDEIAWVSTSYIIANVIVIPMSGWLSAYFGRKRYFTGSILLFTVASFFCGSSHSLFALIFWRVIQGIGGGALLSTAQATLYESFPPEEAGTGMAIFGVGVMVGPTLGPTLGGWITDNYSWPWIFYINVPLGIIAAILTVTYVKDAAHQERADKIDYLGIILLTLCVGSLQWMLERGERYDWWDSRFVTMLGFTALFSGIALIWHELTTDEPVINFRILKSRQLTAGVTFGLLLGFALYGSVFILPVFLQQLLQMTAWQTGKIILPGAIASAVTMAVVGRNAMRLDARYTVIVGAFLFFWSMLKMSHLTSASGQYDLFWPLILRRRRAWSHLRSSHQRDDGRSEGEGSGAGHRHVQSDAAARRLARNRGHGNAARAFHVGRENDARRARRRQRSGDLEPAVAVDARADFARNEPDDGAAAGAGDPGPAGHGAIQHARLLEDLSLQRTRAHRRASPSPAV